MATIPPIPKSAASAPTANPSAQPVAVVVTVPNTVQMPAPPKLEWWEVQGVLPSAAAVIAVIGTALSLHWNTSRNLRAARTTTDDQLAHARAEAQKEREDGASQAQLDRITEARKSVYSDLIDDYGKVQQLIATLPQSDPELRTDTPHPVLSMSASVTKLWIWGEVDTVFQVREFYTQVNEMFYEALTRCIPIYTKQKLLRSLDADVEAAKAKHKKVVEQLRKARRDVLNTPRNGPESVQGLNQEAQEHFERASNFAEQRFKAKLDLMAPIADYEKFLLEGQASLMKQVNKVMAAARMELGLGGDVALLEAQSEAMSTRIEVAMNKYKNKLPAGDVIADF